MRIDYTAVVTKSNGEKVTITDYSFSPKQLSISSHDFRTHIRLSTFKKDEVVDNDCVEIKEFLVSFE